MIGAVLKRFLLTKEQKTTLNDFETFAAKIVGDLIAEARKQDPDHFLSEAAFILSSAILVLDDSGLGHVVKRESIAVLAIAVDQSGAEAEDLKLTTIKKILEKLMMADKTATKTAVFIMLIDPNFKG